MPQPVNPVIPNIGIIEEAIAGSSEIIFTATDRQIIRERAGEIDRTRNFREVFKEDGLMPEVENEETTVRQKGLEIPQIKEHQHLLKHSPLYNPQEKVETAKENKPPQENSSLDSVKVANQEKPTPSSAKSSLPPVTSKELNLDLTEILSKLKLEENELRKLIYKIKNLHLKRIFSFSPVDFKDLSETIKKNTLTFCSEEAKPWVAEKLDELTLNTAHYKLNLIKSMQSLAYETKREKDLRWLQKTINLLQK